MHDNDIITEAKDRAKSSPCARILVPEMRDERLTDSHRLFLHLVSSGKAERLSSQVLAALFRTKASRARYITLRDELVEWGYLAVDHSYISSAVGPVGLCKGYKLTGVARKARLVVHVMTDKSQVKRWKKACEAAAAVIDRRRDDDYVRQLERNLSKLTLDLSVVREQLTSSHGPKIAAFFAMLKNGPVVVVDRAGRFYSPAVQLPRVLRPGLLMDGEAMTGIDTRASYLLSAICLYADHVRNTSALRREKGERISMTPLGELESLYRVYREDQRHLLGGKKSLIAWLCGGTRPETQRAFQRIAPGFASWITKLRKTYGRAIYKLWAKHERMRARAMYDALTAYGLMDCVLDEHDGMRAPVGVATEVMEVAMLSLHAVTDGLGILELETEKDQRDSELELEDQDTLQLVATPKKKSKPAKPKVSPVPMDQEIQSLVTSIYGKTWHGTHAEGYVAVLRLLGRGDRVQVVQRLEAVAGRVDGLAGMSKIEKANKLLMAA